jgi:hypothetical protein
MRLLKNRTCGLLAMGAVACVVAAAAGCGDNSSPAASGSSGTGASGSGTGASGSGTGSSGATGASGSGTGSSGATGASGSGTGSSGATGATAGTTGSSSGTPLDAGTGDATVTDGGCNTAALVLGDAGTLLFSFDNGAYAPFIAMVDLPKPMADAGDGGPAFAVSLKGVTNDGNSCPGALQFTAALSALGQQAEVQANYNPAPAHTISMVHLALKLVFPDDLDGSAAPYNGINGLTPFVQWHVGDAAAYSSSTFATFVSSATLTNGGWHQITVPLQSDGGAIALNLDQVGMSILAHNPSDAAVVLPTTAVVLVDDIWFE